jgi:hypothetical protein
LANDEPEEPEFKPRQWHTINTKIDKKSMDKIDMSTEKDTGINLEAEMEKYLGGDDEVLHGFLESDEEITFDAINPNEKAD